MNLLWTHIDHELSNMRQAIIQNNSFLKALDQTQENSVLYNGLIGSIAMNLQSFYTGAERIFLKIARDVDSSIPKGENWHKALLEQMAIATDSRPELISGHTFLILKDLRGFRHFVRNAYTYSLDSQKVLSLANLLTRCYDHLNHDYLHFKRSLT